LCIKVQQNRKTTVRVSLKNKALLVENEFVMYAVVSTLIMCALSGVIIVVDDVISLLVVFSIKSKHVPRRHPCRLHVVVFHAKPVVGLVVEFPLMAGLVVAGLARDGHYTL